ENVLEVPNAALRFKPSDAQLAELKANAPQQTSTATKSVMPSRNDGEASPASQRTRGSLASLGMTRGSGGTLYTLDANGKLVATRVRTGVSDGTTTEVRGKDLKEGMKVIAGNVSAAQSAQTS